MNTRTPRNVRKVDKGRTEDLTIKHDFTLPPKGKRAKSIRFVANFEDNAENLAEVDQAICRHLLRFDIF